MSFASPIPPFDPNKHDRWSKGSSGLAQQFCGVSRFLREFKTQLRFGRLSRSPLRLARFLIAENEAECDWIARDQDLWDADLSHDIGRRHASLQALRDAIDIRALLFTSLPELGRARFRVFRESHNHSRELIIIGNVRSDESSHRGVHSLVMRAKLVGLRFEMDDGFLRRLPRDEQFGSGD
jgi:hypothetical protein